MLLRTGKMTLRVFNMLRHVAAVIPGGGESLIHGFEFFFFFNNSSTVTAKSERTTQDGGGGNICRKCKKM